MKKYSPLIVFSLGVCLFIYLFYRTEKTLVNQVFISLVSHETYTALKSSISTFLPLQDFLVYSLPEGLWVFCITLTSMNFYIKAGGSKISLVFVPILFALLLECFQALHVTNGRFDVVDISFSFVFWLTAYLFATKDQPKENLLGSVSITNSCCILSYCIVYLAHVLH